MLPFSLVNKDRDSYGILYIAARRNYRALFMLTMGCLMNMVGMVTKYAKILNDFVQPRRYVDHFVAITIFHVIAKGRVQKCNHDDDVRSRK